MEAGTAETLGTEGGAAMSERISNEEVQEWQDAWEEEVRIGGNGPDTGDYRFGLRLLAERKELLARIKELEAAAAALRAALRQHPEGLCYYCSSLLDD